MAVPVVGSECVELILKLRAGKTAFLAGVYTSLGTARGLRMEPGRSRDGDAASRRIHLRRTGYGWGAHQLSQMMARQRSNGWDATGQACFVECAPWAWSQLITLSRPVPRPVAASKGVPSA